MQFSIFHIFILFPLFFTTVSCTTLTTCESIFKFWTISGGSILSQTTTPTDFACSEKCRENVNCGTALFTVNNRVCKLYQMKDLVLKSGGKDSVVVKYTTTFSQCLPDILSILTSKTLWNQLPNGKSVRYTYQGAAKTTLQVSYK